MSPDHWSKLTWDTVSAGGYDLFDPIGYLDRKRDRAYKQRVIVTPANYFSELIEEENSKLKQKLNHLENYSHRDNLVIRGITETKHEVCETVMKKFCRDKLKLDSEFIDSVRIVRCHRLGERQHGKPKWIRPIVVRFYNFGDRQQVWGARSKLAGTPYSVTENFTVKLSITGKSYTPSSRLLKRCKNMRKRCTCMKTL